MERPRERIAEDISRLRVVRLLNAPLSRMFWLWARRRKNESRERKVDLDRMAAMLSRLGKGAMPSRKSPQAMESIPISIAISIPMKQIPNKTVLDNRLPAPSPNDFGNHNP